MHILPRGFMKIRHYGILSSRAKKGDLASARKSLNAIAPPSLRSLSWQELFQLIFGREPMLCPKCKTAQMQTVAIHDPHSRGSPQEGIRFNAQFDLQ